MSRTNKSREELRNDIMEAAIKVFNEKGLKLTMDDVSKECRISKKTLYLVFSDKDEMLLAMIDYCFDSIKACEKEIHDDPSMSTVDKIKKIMVIMPDRYKEVDFSKITNLKHDYPMLYDKMAARLENDWEPTIELIEKGIKEGEIKKNLNIPVLKAIIGGSIEFLLGEGGLASTGISYNEALDSLIDIVMDGIKTR